MYQVARFLCASNIVTLVVIFTCLSGCAAEGLEAAPAPGVREDASASDARASTAEAPTGEVNRTGDAGGTNAEDASADPSPPPEPVDVGPVDAALREAAAFDATSRDAGVRDAPPEATPPALCAARTSVAESNSPTMIASGFAAGRLAPFNVCTTQTPDYGAPATLDGEACAKFFWSEAGYNGTRMRRGAEGCSDLAFNKEGWYGLRFYLPSPGFPLDKTEGIAQVFSLGGCSSWAGMLQVHQNDLWFEHRGNCASPAEFQVRIATAIKRNSWQPVIMHFVASHQGAGLIEIWYGDDVCTPEKPTYRKAGINFGFGQWTGDTLSAIDSNSIALKFGMYNFDDANYTPGETRTIYYDNVTQLVGTAPSAFAMVNPGR